MPILAQEQYTAVADLIGVLPSLVAGNRTRLRLSVPDAAAQIGVGATTLTNFEAGTSNPTQATLLKVLRWLAV